MAVWKPFSIAASSIIQATTVLPLPTSPCNNRCIGSSEFISFKISLIAFFCAEVNSNGNDFMNLLTKPSSLISKRTVFDCLVVLSRNESIFIWSKKNSSYTNVFLAWFSKSWVFGKCIISNAWFFCNREYLSIKKSGNRFCMLDLKSFNALWIDFLRALIFKFSTRG